MHDIAYNVSTTDETTNLIKELTAAGWITETITDTVKPGGQADRTARYLTATRRTLRRVGGGEDSPPEPLSRAAVEAKKAGSTGGGGSRSGVEAASEHLEDAQSSRSEARDELAVIKSVVSAEAGSTGDVAEGRCFPNSIPADAQSSRSEGRDDVAADTPAETAEAGSTGGGGSRSGAIASLEHLEDTQNRSSEGSYDLAVITAYGSPRCDRDRESGGSPTSGAVHAHAQESGVSPASGPGDAGLIPLRDFESMRAMASSGRRAIVGFDTEFTDVVNSIGQVVARDVVSYQFSTVDPLDPTMMCNLVVVPLDGVRLRASTALRLVVEGAGLTEHVACSVMPAEGVQLSAGYVWRSHDGKGRWETYDSATEAAEASEWPLEREALLASVRNASGGPRQARDWTRRRGTDEENVHGLGVGWELDERKLFREHSLSLMLVSHFGSADLSTFLDVPGEPDMMMLIKAGGGLVSDRPKRVLVGNPARRGRAWPIKLEVRDTIAHAPAGMGSLAALGRSCGVPKLSVGSDIERMRSLLREDPVRFIDYARNDAEIVVEYVSRVWGEGAAVPMTLPSAAASSLKASAMAYFEFSGKGASAQFNARFSGLKEVDLGLTEVERDDHLTYYEEKDMQPLNESARVYQHASAFSYRGGYNGCSEVGWIGEPTFDHDLENAYPTAMAMTPDLDFESDQGCIVRTIENQVLTPEDLPSPTTPFVGEVRFEFPENVLYPCIPVAVGGSVVYPRTSEGINGVHVQGPELWLALTLGARVTCLRGYFGRVLYTGPRERSMSLRRGVKQLIDDRTRAKEVFGKKSLEELVFKTAVNSGYGKVAQQVAAQRSWDAMAQEMKMTAGSAITSPHHAAMTTSLVRATLLATMNQLHEAGWRVYSVTTDGMITNCPLEELVKLDLYGMAPLVKEARMALTGDESMWDVKHSMPDGFVNGLTRLNIALDEGGVMAHGGFQSPDGMDPDSVEDRAWMHDQYIGREGPLENSYRRFTPFRELSAKAERKDFLATTIHKNMRMDFDLKRCPVLENMSTDMVSDSSDESVFEVARVPTRPWESVSEARQGRAVGRTVRVLRTEDDWRLYGMKLEHGFAEGRRISDARRAMLLSIIIGHRRGSWEIPSLNGKRPLSWKLEWLSAWGLGEVKKSDWDNARRPEREGQMLPREACEPWLTRMLETPEGHMPSVVEELDDVE